MWTEGFIDFGTGVGLDFLDGGARLLSVEEANDIVAKVSHEEDGLILRVRAISGAEMSGLMELIKNYEGVVRDTLNWRNVANTVQNLPPEVYAEVVTRIGRPGEVERPDMREFCELIGEALVLWASTPRA